MRYVAVDWSGARRPRGKIWLAEVTAGLLRRLEPLDSRDQAAEYLEQYLQSETPTVVGLDFSFSLPCWFCRYLGVASAPDLWERVASDGEQWLSSCAWPFWGRPGIRRPRLPAHLRRTEMRVGEAQRIRPASTFQIGGAGAVGTGSVRGMPYLTRLRAAGWAVWPFDLPGRITIVEMYPRALTGSVVKGRRSARQAYIAASCWPWSDAHRRATTESEDAFDAAVSALVLAASEATPEPRPELDRVTRMEGEIWLPERLMRV